MNIDISGSQQDLLLRGGEKMRKTASAAVSLVVVLCLATILVPANAAAMSVTLESPPNNTVTMNNQPDFKFTATHTSSPILSCTLWLKLTTSGTSTAYGTNSNVVNGASTIIRPSSPIPNGQYQWWISCSDGTTSIISEKRTITVNVFRGDRSFTASLDGSTRYYWLDLPDHFDSSVPTPLVIFLHGYGQDRSMWRTYFPAFRQIFHQNGWMVACAECRTIGGYSAWYTAPSRSDITDVINLLEQEFNVDRSHIHVMGTSMGGSGTLKYAMFNPEIIASACDIMGVTEFIEFHDWTTDSNLHNSIEATYGGTPSAVPQVYKDENPWGNEIRFRHTPVFLLHGSADTVVPVSNSRNLYSSLTQAGYEVKYVEAPGVGHYATTLVEGHEQEIFNWFNNHPMLAAYEECRMWGMVSSAFPQSVVMSQLVSLPASLKNLGGGPGGPGNVNGWGLIYYALGTPVVARGQSKAYTDSNFNAAAQALASSGKQVGMGHVRNAASGAVNIPDPHPFVRVRGGKTWTLAHNGVLNIANLKALIGPTYLSYFTPAVGSNWSDPDVVDSDLYLIYVLKCVEESGWDVKAGIAVAETEIYRTDSSSNANFLLSDGTSMWGYRKSVDSSHTLYYKYDASQQYSAIASQPPEGSGLGDWVSMSNFNLVEISADSPPALYEDIRSYGLEADDFTVVVLPDTQFYSKSYPSIFDSQTQWVVDHEEDLNIVFVTHEGDIVNDNEVTQWQRANHSMSILDTSDVPWGVLPGNHDMYDGSIKYNTYFGYGRFSGEDWYGGAYQNVNTNNYELFTGGLDDYLIFHFQYQPSTQVLAWANTTIASYPNMRVIVTTHDYMNTDGTRTTTGNNIWNKFVKHHADQIFLVLCGHNHGENEKIDVVNGHTVYQLLADYQEGYPNGGNGWLRILEFHPAEDEIYVKTYSPYVNQYQTDGNSQFTLDYDMTSEQAFVIDLESPEDGLLTMDNMPDFSFTATHFSQNPFSCTLWLEDATQSIAYATKNDVTNGSLTTLTPSTPIPNGDWSWWISCSDGATSAISDKRTITVNAFRGDKTFTSTLDGSIRKYWLDLPDDFDDSAPTPLVIFLHGYGGSRLSYPQKYPSLRQTFQSNGWIVASVDCRTVNGYQDWYIEPSRRDITDVLNTIRSDYNIDASHVHVMGNSMGGGGALKYAMFNNQVIASVVDIHGVTDFTQFYIDSSTYKASLVAAYGGTPSQVPDVYADESALGNEERFSNTPVMMLHGSADNVVSVFQSRDLYQSLSALGYTVEYIEVPGVAHDASILISGREAEIFSWLRDHPLNVDYPSDRVVVGFEVSVPQDFDETVSGFGGSILSINDRINFVLVSVPEPDEFIVAMLNLQGVIYAERDAEVCALDFTPNDTYYSSQQWGPQDIYAPAAWDTTMGSSSVIIAIVDSGIDYNHPDLMANVWTNSTDGTHGYNFVSSNKNPLDDNGHGTHCSGIAAAVINNGVGIAGISQSSIMAVKVLDSGGSGSMSNVANGITWATDHGANIISLSLGGTSDLTTVRNAVSYAYSHNVLLVAAAGNQNGRAVLYPARYDQVIAVSALNQGDTLASYSSTGSQVELAASGTSIISTYSGGGYATMSGTSMACPHVSGVAALVLAVNPSLSNINLRNILDTTAVDLGPAGRDYSYGYGKVNTAAAVQSVLSTIQFTASVMSSDASGTVLTIDSTDYTYAQLQSHTFSWAPGSTHTVTASDPVSADSGKRYRWMGWTNGDGLSGVGPGTYTVPASSQTVTVNYKTQYYLTVNNGGHGTVGGADWYDAGTNAQATITPLTVPGSTGVQYVFTGWSGAASGTGSPSNNILMNDHETAIANWKTQYQVSFDVSPIGGGSITNPPSSPQWYDAGATGVSISATPSTGYTFSSWASDTASITFADVGIPSTTATIGSPGTITARVLAVMQNVLYMPFTTAATPIPDTSNNDNEGTPHNGVTWQSSYGGCYGFNGLDGYIQVSDSPSLSPTDQVTVECWIKYNAKGNVGLVWKSGYNYLLYGPDGGSVSFICWDSSGSASTASFSSDLIQVGGWYHVAGVLGSDHVARLYLNGQPVGSVGNAIAGIRDSPGDLFIGRRGDGVSDCYFNGLLDEVRVYNRGLSAAEVQQDYTAAKAEHT